MTGLVHPDRTPINLTRSLKWHAHDVTGAEQPDDAHELASPHAAGPAAAAEMAAPAHDAAAEDGP